VTEPWGSTRSVVRSHYALLTPAGLVWTPLPGWSDAEGAIVIAPRMGALFHQIMLRLGPSGAGLGTGEGIEQLVFVLAGRVEARIGDYEGLLAQGGFCYIPPDQPWAVRAATDETRLLSFQRRYAPLPGVEPPAPLLGDEAHVAAAPFMGDEGAMLKTLLPTTEAFDMAVNIFTFQPGATLPIVETHIMEHGLLLIQGQGIYRLGDDWHPVQAGDTIWMAPYCPQWFVATGKTPARYIYYKDVNRDPVE
jgi:(S)-ureidoglycine aminohydrolase